METDFAFGSGPTLQEHCPFLRDNAERVDRILNVAERNSIIEGLPAFSMEVRHRLRAELLATNEPPRASVE